MYLEHFKLNALPFSLTPETSLKTLNKKELSLYFADRLAQAGNSNAALFSNSAKKCLFRASAGNTQQLHRLCHKALLISYGRGINHVDIKSMKCAIADTESIQLTRFLSRANVILTLTIFTCIIAILTVYRKSGLI